MTPEPIDPRAAEAPILLPVPESERRSQTITYFVGITLLWLVISYSALGLLSAYHPPQDGAYDIITASQAGLKDFILMALGGFLGAITQKHA